MLARLSALAGAILVVAAQPACAQDEASDGIDEVVDEIIVTGSRLPRRDYSAPSPIATVDREMLTHSGQATLEESLNKMPQVAPDFGRTSNNPGDGYSTVNLRGLGADRTLVLLNGRRVAPSGSGSAVDINNLPQVLMERVEIITGGATTVYGADAVAGVVNFITRSDFEGFAVQTSAYVTEAGDSNIYDINLAYGHNFASGRGNVTFYGGYYDREATFASQREFTDHTIWDYWDGTTGPGGSSTVPEGIIHSPRYDFGSGSLDRITFDSDGNPRPYDPAMDFYNYAPGNYLQIPLRRATAGAILSYDLTDKVEFYAEASFTQNDATQNLAPVPASGFYEINPDNPVLTPQMQQIAADEFFPLGPGLVGAVIGRRMVELGPRTIETEQKYTRFVGGLRGEISEVWDYDIWLSWTEGKENKNLLNDASYARVQQGLLVDPGTGQCFDPSGACVPVNLFGAGNLSQEALDFVRYEPFLNQLSRRQKLLGAFVRGAPFDSWAGPIQMAFGIEYRNDGGDFQADPALFLDDALGYQSEASIVGEESVYEAYMEAIVPLADGAAWAEYLGLEFGARYSDYDHAGGVSTWKIGGEWQLPAPVKFRTMFQHSVRAPNLQEAFTEQGIGSGSFAGNANDVDPCSATNDPVGSGFADACIASGLPRSELGTWTATLGYPTDIVFGGNPELQPETADTFTAGFVLDLDLLQGVQVSVDYFDLKIEDTIGELDVSLACYDTANTEQLFCENIQRDPLSYNVEEVYEPYINRGVYQVRGVDTQLNMDTTLEIGVNIVWTHMLENAYQETEFGTVFECTGSFGYPCNFSRYTSVYPENRINTTLTWYRDDFDVRATWRWIEGTTNGLVEYADELGLGWAELGLVEAPDKSYLDLAFGYRISDMVVARLTVANVTDTSPPLLADYAFANNTDAAVYDLFGRAYTLSLSLEF